MNLSSALIYAGLYSITALHYYLLYRTYVRPFTTVLRHGKPYAKVVLNYTHKIIRAP